MIAVASAFRNGFADLRKAVHFGVWGAAGGLGGAFVDESNIPSYAPQVVFVDGKNRIAPKTA